MVELTGWLYDFMEREGWGLGGGGRERAESKDRMEWVSVLGDQAALVLQLCLFDPYPQACLPAR